MKRYHNIPRFMKEYATYLIKQAPEIEEAVHQHLQQLDRGRMSIQEAMKSLIRLTEGR